MTKSAAKVRRRVGTRKDTSEENRDAVDFKNKIQPYRADLTGRKQLHLLRTFIEIIAQWQDIVQDEDSSVLGPATDIHRLRGLKHLAGGGDVNGIHVSEE